MQPELLAPLAARFARDGLSVTFGPEFAAWVASQQPGEGEAAPDLSRPRPGTGAGRVAAARRHEPDGRVADGRPVLVEPPGTPIRPRVAGLA